VAQYGGVSSRVTLQKAGELAHLGVEPAELRLLGLGAAAVYLMRLEALEALEQEGAHLVRQWRRAARWKGGR
jgi:hypothetical protein